jgi:ABC-2 type transport system ATP-binding protein
MIEARNLTKRYGGKLAVDDVTLAVRPGVVTGFLGPNGAGKSTTMRLILGLDRATSGSVTVNGRPYAQHRHPLREVGALLEARAVHPGRSAYHHLLALARSNDIPRRSGWATSPDAGPASSRSAWHSASASPPPCSATRAR